MSTILGVKFRDAGQIYYFSSGAFVVNPGDSVIVNSDQGYGLGTVVLVRDDLPEDAETEEIKPIYRIAGGEDLDKHKENEELAKEAFEYCRKRIRERKLEMKLVDVDVFFDRSKIIFYFTAPNRIDFRELVKDLVRTYRTRIELRQIGVRHETQMVGAVGNCGQVCCCRRFLRKFAPVTIRMAKEQNLFLNPAKISGMCGRLLCCLSYEQSNYEEFHRSCPKIGKKYVTRDGGLKVLRANLFRNSLSVVMDGGEEREYTLEEWEELAPKRPDQVQQQAQQAPQPAQSQEAQPRRGKPRKQAEPREQKEQEQLPAVQEPVESTETEQESAAPPVSDSGGIFGLGPEKPAEKASEQPAEKPEVREPKEAAAGASVQEERGEQEKSGGRPPKSKRKRSSRSRRGGRSKGQGGSESRGESRGEQQGDKAQARTQERPQGRGQERSQGKGRTQDDQERKPSRPKQARPPKQEGGAKPEGESKGKPRRKRKRKPKPKQNQQ